MWDLRQPPVMVCDTWPSLVQTFFMMIRSPLWGFLNRLTLIPLSSQRIFSTSTISALRLRDPRLVCSIFLASSSCLAIMFATFASQVPAKSIPSTIHTWYWSKPMKKRCMQSIGIMVVGSQYTSSISTE